MDILVKRHIKCMFTYPDIISRFKESNSSCYGKFVTFYFQRSMAINIKIKHHQEPLKCRFFLLQKLSKLVYIIRDMEKVVIVLTMWSNSSTIYFIDLTPQNRSLLRQQNIFLKLLSNRMRIIKIYQIIKIIIYMNILDKNELDFILKGIFTKFICG